MIFFFFNIWMEAFYVTEHEVLWDLVHLLNIWFYLIWSVMKSSLYHTFMILNKVYYRPYIVQNSFMLPSSIMHINLCSILSSHFMCSIAAYFSLTSNFIFKWFKYLLQRRLQGRMTSVLCTSWVFYEKKK